MTLEQDLRDRSDNTCEICANTTDLDIYSVPYSPMDGVEAHLFLCETCQNQIETPQQRDPNHWRCLNDSIWSEVPAVKVMSWRMLYRLKAEGWPQDLLDMMYLEDHELEWAKAAGDVQEKSERIIHRDSNGVILEAGDSVVLVKDLKVKGSSMVAKQGTAVRRISLDHENEKYIEGKVNGQQIVIITDYVKKT
ncbi:alkylphosphonate utilization protein [Gangjinia marincola]|uniref:Alkylphosphonate utilization protein n=1 Tax=Gangjinia marincola TaxID=578463 RepID=A0ABN1MGY3_9FLAO